MQCLACQMLTGASWEGTCCVSVYCVAVRHCKQHAFGNMERAAIWRATRIAVILSSPISSRLFSSNGQTTKDIEQDIEQISEDSSRSVLTFRRQLLGRISEGVGHLVVLAVPCPCIWSIFLVIRWPATARTHLLPALGECMHTTTRSVARYELFSSLADMYSMLLNPDQVRD